MERKDLSILTLNQSTSCWFCFRQSLRLQLNPRTSLVSFIWSVFSSNLPTILQRWNKSQMFMWQAKKICSVVFFLAFPRMECKIKSNFKIEDSLDNNIWRRIKLKWQSSTLFPTSKNQSLKNWGWKQLGWKNASHGSSCLLNPLWMVDILPWLSFFLTYYLIIVLTWALPRLSHP